MLEKNKFDFEINFPENKTKIIHDREAMNGPDFIEYNGKVIAENFSCYVDDRKDSAAVVRHSKGYNKSGVSTVEMSGYLPVGSEIHFDHKYQYTARSARIVSDINLHHGTVINRHFGIGSFELPGKWTKFSVIPAPQHINDGAKITTTAIPEATTERQMIGHWHRPPLSIIFENEEGFVFEVGTGFDNWRWENCLNYAPESGSYKLFLTESCIQVVREPLMCCQDYTPELPQHRFAWFLSWGKREKTTAPDNLVWLDAVEPDFPEDCTEIGIDIHSNHWHDSFKRITSSEKFALGETSDHACFAHHKVQSHLKKTARRLKAHNPKKLWIKNLEIGICYNPSHVARKDVATCHNDSTYILGFLAWLENLFKDSCEIVVVTNNGEKSILDFDV